MSKSFPTLPNSNGENIPPLGDDKSPQLSKQSPARRLPFGEISDSTCGHLNTLSKLDTDHLKKNNDSQQLSAASLAAQSLIQEINQLALKDNDKKRHSSLKKKHSVNKRHRRHPSSCNSFASSTDQELSRMTSPSLDTKAPLPTGTGGGGSNSSNNARGPPKRHYDKGGLTPGPNDSDTRLQQHQGYLDFAAFKKLKYKALSESPEQRSDNSDKRSNELTPTINHKANTKSKRERYTNLKLDLAHRAAASKVASKVSAHHVAVSQTSPSTPAKNANSDHDQSLPVTPASTTTLAYIQGKTFTLATGQKVQVRIPVMSRNRRVDPPVDISVLHSKPIDSDNEQEDTQTSTNMSTPQTEVGIVVQFPDLKEWASHMQQVREKRLLELGVTRSRPASTALSSTSMGEPYSGIDMASRRSSINSGLNISLMGMGSPQMDSSSLGGTYTRMSGGVVAPPYYPYDGEDKGDMVGSFQTTTAGPLSPFKRPGSPGSSQLEGGQQYGPGSPATASFLNPTSYPVIDSYPGATSSFYDQQQQDTIYYQDPTGALYQQGAFNFQQQASHVLSGDFVFQPKVKKVLPIVDPETKTSFEGDKFLTPSPVKQRTESGRQVPKKTHKSSTINLKSDVVFDNMDVLLEEVSKEVEPLHDLLRRHFDNLERRRKKRKMGGEKSGIHDQGYEAESDSDSGHSAGGEDSDSEGSQEGSTVSNEARMLWNPSKLVGEFDQVRDSLARAVGQYIINQQQTVSAAPVGREEAVGYMGGALDSLFEQVEQRDALIEKIEAEHNETVDSLEREIRTRQLEVDALKTQLEEFCNEEKELQIQRDMDLQRLFQANEREKSKLRKENEQAKQKIKDYEMELQVERVLNRDRQEKKRLSTTPGQDMENDNDDNNNNNNNNDNDDGNEMMTATRAHLLELEKTIQTKDCRIEEMSLRLKRTEQETRAQNSWVTSMVSSQISNIEDLLLLLRQPGDIDRNGVDEVAVKVQGFLEVQKLSCQKSKLAPTI